MKKSLSALTFLHYLLFSDARGGRSMCRVRSTDSMVSLTLVSCLGRSDKTQEANSAQEKEDSEALTFARTSSVSTSFLAQP